MKSRYNNLDLFRLICATGVIILHVTTIFELGIVNPNIFGRIINKNTFLIVYINTAFRFAVPCFLMLTGALTIEEKNSNYKKFYKRSLKKIFIPCIYISVIAIAYTLFKGLIEFKLNGVVFNWKDFFHNIIIGKPFYHLWYIYMLIPIYFTIPYICIIEEKISKKEFNVMSIIVMFWGLIGNFTVNTNNNIQYGLGFGLNYLGYVLVGHMLFEFFKNKKNNLHSIIMLCSSLAIPLLLTIIILNCNLISNNTKLNLVDPASPIIAIYSILIFISFTKLKITKSTYNYTKYTYFIFLIHAFILDVLIFFTKKYLMFIPVIVLILLITIAVFIISYFLSLIADLLISKIK